MKSKNINSLNDVLVLMHVMSEAEGITLDAKDCADFRDALIFLKDREEASRASIGGYQPRPTGRPIGRPPSGGGSGRR